MVELNGKPILGRPVKIGPSFAKSKGKRQRGESAGDFRNVRDRPTPISDRWTRMDAAEHLKGYSEQGRRLFVGGLPWMPDHNTGNADVQCSNPELNGHLYANRTLNRWCLVMLEPQTAIDNSRSRLSPERQQIHIQGGMSQPYRSKLAH